MKKGSGKVPRKIKCKLWGRPFHEVKLEEYFSARGERPCSERLEGADRETNL